MRRGRYANEDDAYDAMRQREVDEQCALERLAAECDPWFDGSAFSLHPFHGVDPLEAARIGGYEEV